MNDQAHDDQDFEDLPVHQQALQVMRMYKLGLDLVHYRSFWYRLLALAGHGGARRDQSAFAAGDQTAVRIINSSPQLQDAWRQLCASEPPESHSKRFLSRVLRSACQPLRLRSIEERQRARNKAWAFGNQCQKRIDELNKLAGPNSKDTKLS